MAKKIWQENGNKNFPLVTSDFKTESDLRPVPSVQLSHQRSCRHCGTLFQSNTASDFCCTGCEFVNSLIHQTGLDDYYRIRDSSPPSCPLPVPYDPRSSSEAFEYCDDPIFLGHKTTQPVDSLEFYLEGLNCTACLWLLERLPNYCPDAFHARVNMAASTITVTRVAEGSFAAIARTLNRFGHRPHPLSATSQDKGRELLQKIELRRDMIRMGIAGAATGNIMIYAVSLYAGATGVMAEHFRLLSAGLALPVLTYGAWPFYKSAWSGLKNRHLNIDVPIVASLLAGIAVSIWSLLSGRDAVFFDSLSMLVFLLLASRLWLKSLQRRYLDVSHIENSLLVATVTRVGVNGDRQPVSSLSLATGDIIELTGEATVPADGEITSGQPLLTTSVLTGESEAFEAQQGCLVEAGSISLAGTWQMRVNKPAGQSRLASILRDAGHFASHKPQILKTADRVARWFIGVVFLAALGVILRFASSAPLEGLVRALSLIIVTCPCVFGIAIPLSLSLALRAAAERGIVVKDAEAFERLRKIRTLFFDKTGTLTIGRMRVLNFTSTSEDVDVSSTYLAIAQALEDKQVHPVARAICSFAATVIGETPVDAKGAALIDPAENVTRLPKGGIEGSIGGCHYKLLPAGPTAQNSDPAVRNLIRSCYELRSDDRLLATFELGDRLRPEAKNLIQSLRDQQYSVRILSGDRPAMVDQVAADLGFKFDEVLASVTPEEKSQILAARAMGESMMIGDGVNDAAALAAASIGVAVRGSMDISLRAADIFLMRSDLGALSDLFNIAHDTERAIRRNLVFSASFNLISGALALTGYMTPLGAAVLMPLSSLVVLTSALYTGHRLTGRAATRWRAK